jgi:replicative DNA helicase
MPTNLESERFVLGSFLLQGAEAVERFGVELNADCFGTEAHRLIWQAVETLYRRSRAIDRVTVAEELHRTGKLETVGGLSYLVSLDSGLPLIPNLSTYVDIIREKSALRRIAVLAQDTLNRALVAEEPAEQIIASARASLDGVETCREGANWADLASTIAVTGSSFDDFISPAKPGSVRGIPTPWRPVNDCLCGIQPGDLFLIAARPSMGKSGAAVQLARHAAETGHSVAYVSLEMSAASLERRLLAQMSNVDSFRMRLGCLPESERDSIRTARKRRDALKILINDKGCRTVPAIRSALRELRGKQPPELVIVDHFHLIRGLHVHEDERTRYNRIADDLQMAAREMGVPFVVLCQLSRKCEEENRAPGLADLKETGKLEENADVVLFIHRPEMYAKNRGREELRGIAEFIIAKQRDGATGKCSMAFIGAQQRFEAAATEHER